MSAVRERGGAHRLAPRSAFLPRCSAAAERSDCCVMEAAAVVAENVVALATLTALLDTFGGDTIDELKSRVSERRQK